MAASAVLPQRAKPTSERMKPAWRAIVLYRVVVGLILTISAGTEFKKDFLCRPDGHGVNAPDGGHGIGQMAEVEPSSS
jgi:hypothetical protein